MTAAGGRNMRWITRSLLCLFISPGGGCCDGVVALVHDRVICDGALPMPPHTERLATGDAYRRVYASNIRGLLFLFSRVDLIEMLL